MTNRTDGLDAAGVAEAKRIVNSWYSWIVAASDDMDFPEGMDAETSIRKLNDQRHAVLDALEATRSSALVDAPAGETKAREAFLDMMADAIEFRTETDEGGTVHSIDLHDSSLRDLVKALGINIAHAELTEDTIQRAIDAGPQPASPTPSVAALQAEIDRLSDQLRDQIEATSFADENRTFQIGRAEAAEAEIDRLRRELEPVEVSIKPMRLSDDRCDYFVSFKHGGREVTPHVFRERFKAEYHVALYRWLFGQGVEPGLLEFREGEWPAREYTAEERAYFAALVPPDTEGEAQPVGTLQQVRDMFDVEYHDDGRIACVGHASDGLRKIVAVLDAALASVPGKGWQPIETAPKDGTVIRVGGERGPYGIVQWEGCAYWGPPKNNYAKESSWLTPYRDGNAHLGLAGYVPTRWMLSASPSPSSPEDGR